MARNSQNSSADQKWVYLAEADARRHPEYGLGGWLSAFQICLWAGIVAGGAGLAFLYDQPKFFRHDPYYLLVVCGSIQVAMIVFLSLLFYLRFPSINLAVFLFALLTLVAAAILYRDVAQFRALVCLDDNALECRTYLTDQAALDRIFDVGIVVEIGVFVLAGVWGLVFAQSRRVAITFQHRMRPNDPLVSGRSPTSATLAGPVAGPVAGPAVDGLPPMPGTVSTLVANSMVLEPERDDIIADLTARIARLEQIVHREGAGLIAELVEPPVPCTEPAVARPGPRQDAGRKPSAVQRPGVAKKAASPAALSSQGLAPVAVAADRAGNTVQYLSDTPLTLPPHIVSSVETLGESVPARISSATDSPSHGWVDDLIEDGNLAYDRNHRSVGDDGGEPAPSGAGDVAKADSAERPRLTGLDGRGTPPSPTPFPTAAAAKPSPQPRAERSKAAAPPSPEKPVRSAPNPAGTDRKPGATRDSGWAPFRPASAAPAPGREQKRPPFAPKTVIENPEAAAQKAAADGTPGPDRSQKGVSTKPEKKQVQGPKTKPEAGDGTAPETNAQARPASLPDNVAEHPSARRATRRVSQVETKHSPRKPQATSAATGASATAKPDAPAQPRPRSSAATPPATVPPEVRDRGPERKNYNPVRIRPRSQIRTEDLPSALRKHASTPEDDAAGDAGAVQPTTAGTPSSPAKPAGTATAEPTAVFWVENGAGRVSGTWDGDSEITYKECPSCAERIKIRAKHCRHCDHTYFASQYETEQEAFAHLVGDSPIPAAARAIQALRSQIVDVLTNIGEDLQVYLLPSGVFELRNRRGRVLHAVTAQKRQALEQMREEIIAIKGLLYEIAEFIDSGKAMKDRLAKIQSAQDIAQIQLIDGVKLGDCRKMLELLGQLVR